MKLREVLNVTPYDKITIINMNEKLNSDKRFICKRYDNNLSVYENEEPYFNFYDYEVIQIELWKDSICYRIK